jgi:hypothetical protein
LRGTLSTTTLEASARKIGGTWTKPISATVEDIWHVVADGNVRANSVLEFLYWRGCRITKAAHRDAVGGP